MKKIINNYIMLLATLMLFFVVNFVEGAASGQPTLFIIGDSTAQNGSDRGWGSHLADFFDPNKITIVNRARAGRSSRTFYTEGLWENVLADMKKGDFVLIQFGHNDGGPINDNRRARGSLAGLGDEANEIDNLVTGKHEIVHTFGWYMRRFIQDAKAKGSVPIVLSLTVRNIWKDGLIERGMGHYGQWAAQLAESEGVAFIDLTNIIADHYELLGPDKLKAFFPEDHTHTSAEAAYLNASLVVSGLKDISGCPLSGYLSQKGREVKPYSEFRMTRTWMPEAQPKSDPNLPTLFLIGDSTVRNGTRGDGANGQWGWGAPLGDFFDRKRINVENRAMGGTSSRTYRSLRLWDNVLTDIKPGDYCIIQFGHNDGGPLNDQSRARGTIKGNGDQTEEIENMLTGTHEIVHTYGWYLRQYINEIRAKGGIAIVCSPIPRNIWSADGKVFRSSDSYSKWAAQAAQDSGAFFIDLNEIIAACYEAEGQKSVSERYFGPKEHTHTTATGALCNAASVVKSIKNLKDCNLKKYLGEKSTNIL